MKGIRYMKIYEIYDEDNELSVGVLLYYEKEKSYIIELQENLDEWTAPLLFTAYVRKRIYTIPRDISYLWVKERVIPSGRQNLGAILARHHLKEYNEMTFLEISEGRCSQDSLCIRRIETLPTFVKKRTQRNIVECMITEDNQILCIFANDVIKKVNIAELTYIDDVKKIINNKALFDSIKVGTGGYSIVFNESIDIPAGILYEKGIVIPLSLRDFTLFVQKNVLDTSECCEVLECSRQNISYIVKEKHLTTVKENVKGNLYFKGDVLRNKW